MRVTKRTGETEDVSFDKVLTRIKNLSNGLSVDIYDIAQKVCSRIYDNVKTSELDELAAQLCSSLIIENPDYGVLSSRIIISNHHKNTSPSFSETIHTLYNNINPIVSEKLHDIVMKNKEKLNTYIDYSRDYNYDYFGFKTLERSYLLKIDGKIIERPQHMLMRVSIGIHGDDFKDALQTYDMMSKKYFTHATPTLFNSGTKRQQNSSCFLLGIHDDSLAGIFNALSDCAHISKYAGGIGLHIHNVRAKGSLIRGTNGYSDGIVPMLRVFNNTSRYINQCFTPDTMIFYQDKNNFKGFKRIDQIELTDKVQSIDTITHFDSYEDVLQIFKKEINNEEILNIYNSSSEYPLRCTKVHEIAIIKDNIISFKPAYKLTVDDCMLSSNNIYKINRITTEIYNGIVYDLNIKNNNNYVTIYGLVHNSGKRNGSFAVYLEPWHADIEAFVEMKKNHGSDEDRARDLFYALWIPDLFMERVRDNEMWSLMCPDKCPGLSDVYGEDFNKLYRQYEDEKKYNKQIKAQDIWFKILETQIETGVPYILFKDACNKKSNQKNLGTIKSSNLCVSPNTMILTDDGYYSIKNLKDKVVNVWNGKEFSETQIKQTGSMQKLITVEFDNGIDIKCTPYHKFYIENIVDPIEAIKLVSGMKIQPFKLPDDDKLVEIYVVKIVDNNEFDDTYCFNEPKEHKGVFNGILTGNCTEIIQYTSNDEISVCNLNSICLPTFINYINNKPVFDFEKLHEIAMIVTKNLNKVIDVNFYPLEKARNSNLRHRPIGIGIQGLADLFILMRYPFDSPEAQELNTQIFETIYHGAVQESMLIAKKRNELYDESKLIDKESDRYKVISTHLDWNNKIEPFNTCYPGSYSSFIGSPASMGILQFDLWNIKPSNRYDWGALKLEIAKYGMRNSLLLAPMPTASTSQIMGFNECGEPITSNIYKRKTLSGEFVVINKYLVEDLMKINLWNKDISNKILIDEGSIQNISEIPNDLKALYKTVWEISQKVLIDMAASRGAYVCQSQSMNLFISDPDFKKLTSMLFYSWTSGLKTGCYYLRSKSKAKTQMFTIDPTLSKYANIKPEKNICTDEVCHSCSG
jgi:ribonucleotide reductase alpha subunit